MKTRTALLALAAIAVPAFAAPSSADADFAREAAQGGMAEVELGRLASGNAESASVKAFGERMVADHSKANDALKAAAAKSGIDLPAAPSAKQESARKQLAGMRGAAFDKEYAQMMVKDHEEDVALFRKEASSGSDPNLRAFASETLATLEEHLKLAKELPSGAASKAR